MLCIDKVGGIRLLGSPRAATKLKYTVYINNKSSIEKRLPEQMFGGERMVIVPSSLELLAGRIAPVERKAWICTAYHSFKVSPQLDKALVSVRAF